MKYFLSALCLLLLATADAQQVVRGRILDRGSQKALPMATVSVYAVTGTRLIGYGLTTSEGDFVVTGIPFNLPCRLVVFAEGHELFRKDLLSASETDIQLGHIGLPAGKPAETLTAVEQPPVMVYRDSVIYTTTSFPTLPGSLRNSILRQLPGIRFEKDGTITAGGQPVRRIRMDRSSLGYLDLLQ